jgi:hypothetical protein
MYCVMHHAFVMLQEASQCFCLERGTHAIHWPFNSGFPQGFPNIGVASARARRRRRPPIRVRMRYN